MRKSSIRLLKYLLFLLFFAVLVWFIYRWFFKGEEQDEYAISRTPLHIESIRTIAELATVNYREEIVMDSVEFYQSAAEKIAASMQTDIDQIKYNLSMSPVKRRLTLIIKGSVDYGFDLGKNNFKVSENTDTIWFNLPKPKVLNVTINPSDTEIFQETGNWHDAERIVLQRKAKLQLIRAASVLELDKKSRENFEQLMHKLVPGERTLIFYYDR